jgi:hypothetical protein
MSTLLRTLVLLLVAPGLAGATLLLPADFTDMVINARAIVHGRVVDVRSALTSDRQDIETFVTVAVLEHIKEDLGRAVTFRVPGGQVGRYRSVMVGAPWFDEDDEVVIFLSARGASIPSVFGLSQGVYRVARASDGRMVVTPPPVLARGAAAERVVRGDPARRLLPIAEFTREVRAILERAR